MTSADFLWLTVFDYINFYVLLVVSFINIFTRPHRVSRLTFLFYLFDLLHKVTGIFWTFACSVALSPYTALLSTSCSSSQDFIPYFLHFHFTMDSLYFLNGSLTPMPIVDFHHLVKRHACRTQNNIQASYLILSMFILVLFR